MAAAMRFAFSAEVDLALFRGNDDYGCYRVPAPPSSVMLREPRLIVFLIRLVIGVNLRFGLGSFPSRRGRHADRLGSPYRAVFWPTG